VGQNVSTVSLNGEKQKGRDFRGDLIQKVKGGDSKLPQQERKTRVAGDRMFLRRERTRMLICGPEISMTDIKAMEQKSKPKDNGPGQNC